MKISLREWDIKDAPDLAAAINNKNVLDNLRDGIPFPYTEKDAGEFISTTLNAEKDTQYAFAITCDDKAIGSIGVFRKDNVHRLTAELGYYIAEPYWGKGITTEAVRQICAYVFDNTDIVRIFAEPYAHNAASCRVLEKAGFQFEGLLRQNAIKNGQHMDMKMYAILKSQAREFEIRQVDAAIQERIQPIIVETWGSPYLAVNSRLWDSRAMPGFVALNGDGILGYLLYEFHDGVCEIMALESVIQNIGVASALIEQVKRIAKSGGVGKVIVQTSNDNTHAFRFYQRRGFTIREVRLGAMDAARELKPSIPLIGEDGIPLRDEIEFVIEI